MPSEVRWPGLRASVSKRAAQPPPWMCRRRGSVLDDRGEAGSWCSGGWGRLADGGLPVSPGNLYRPWSSSIRLRG